MNSWSSALNYNHEQPAYTAPDIIYKALPNFVVFFMFMHDLSKLSMY